MRLVRALAAAVPVLLFAACAAVAPGSLPPPAASFDVVGRVLVSGEGRAFSSNLRWRHDAGSDELWLMSPVGQTLAHIAADATGATLTTPDQQEYRAFTAESLTRRALGWPLPLGSLRYWIQAVADPRGDAAAVTRDAAGRLSLLVQDGWSISYDYPEPPAPAALPRRLDLTRDGQRIRLVIDAWRSGDAP
jgi:outer membrane lipoprotein LolB